MNAGTMFGLSGKTAIVTGGKGLYGSAISEGLCEAGAHVIIASRDGLGKWPDRDDIKGPVVFLASEASRYVTGINLLMDGGFTIW
jgi:NAD(P)-dependent dehydrogenase (short-subunit alcohol dehydrogenase family)